MEDSCAHNAEVVGSNPAPGISVLFEILSVCKGGGYRYCRTSPKHPKANSKGLYHLHRVLMENKLGRLLRDDEDVHHKDEDKSNDSIDKIHCSRSCGAIYAN